MDKVALNAEASSVQTHLTIMQRVIERMADNSRACKVWCVTLVSASLILVARIDRPNYILFVFVPIVLFLILDTYYLALERAFRDSYNDFVSNLEKGNLVSSDLYVVKPTGSIPKVFLRSLTSFSIYIFYPILALSILIIRWIF